MQSNLANWRMWTVVLALALFAVAIAPVPLLAQSTELFFSEYIEGSSNNKALEIYNDTGAAIDLAAQGYNVLMYSNGSASAGLTINLTGSVADNDVFVLAHVSADVAILAQADQTAGGGWFNGNDAVVLRKGTTIIDVIGQIGFDPGTEWGSGLTSTMDNTLRRKSTVCVGDANGGDAFDPSGEWDGFATNTFDGLGSHMASCSGPVDTPPSVSSTTPANGASGVEPNANLVVNFSENVTVSGAWFGILCTISGAHSVAVSGGPQSFTLDPDIDFTAGEFCTVTIFAAQVTDQDDVPDAMTADHSWSFNAALSFAACGDSAQFIHDVQGIGAASPQVRNIVNVEGVVVGDYQGASPLLRGFYLQEEDADADGSAATSEGIFVFSDIAVNAGDVVRIQGTIVEFGDPDVALTELSSITNLEVCTSGASVTPTAINLPVSSSAEWEQYEGMLVTFPKQLTVTENFTLGRFGELVLSSGGRLFTPTHFVAPGAPAQAAQELNNRNRILLDDAQTAQNPDPVIYPSPFLSATNTLRAGYTVDNLTGILDQRFDLYRVQPLSAISFNPANPRPAMPADVGGAFKVASANVLNYFTTLDDGGADCGPAGNQQECRGANTAVEFERQRAKILAALSAINADVVGLIELENNAAESLQNLVDGLNGILGAGTYAYIDTGFIGTDAIKVALIYKPATVSPEGDHAILDSTVDPTFIDTLNRPVLAQTFRENASGEIFTVAVNHLKSKGSDCNGVGDPDTGDGQGNCNGTRTNAAAALVNWLGTDPTGSSDPDYLLIGDLNSYALEDPITTIKNAGYSDLIALFGGAAAYSFVFQGQSGYLDHALASPSLLHQVTGAAEWHTNADEPIVLDYNVEFKSAAQVGYFYAPNPYRFSDHDPLVVGLDLDSETTITIVKDARPDNVRNFRFSGDLDDFRLDDPGFDDHDSVGSSITFQKLEAGTYTVTEDVPHFWHLTGIVCEGGSADVDLAGHRVAITVLEGEDAVCTFTNEYGSALWVHKYLDHNADGRRTLEPGLSGWKISLYNSAGALVASDTTNIFGKVHFRNLAPGQYTVCETLRNGWFNSQPGVIDPVYQQPCTTLTIGPAQLWIVEFGNHRNARLAAAGVLSPNGPTQSQLAVEEQDDESYADDGAFVDEELNRPAEGEPFPIFLPFIVR